MFNFLKDKLEKWTKNIAKKPEEPKEKKSKKKEKEKKSKENKIKEKEKKREDKKSKKEQKKQDSQKLEELQESKELQEISLPEKFNPGVKKYEPDLEILKKEVSKIEDKENEEDKKEEENEEENKPGTKSFFKKITSGINKIKISEEEYKKYSEELENILLENNVALEVAERMTLDLKENLVGKEFLKKEVEFQIKTLFGDIIRNILINPPDLLEKIKSKNYSEKEPYIILFCGINGSGKTTTIAKLGNYLQSKNISCIMAAGDTFRAASIEQIKEHGKKLNIPVINHDYGTDPASVGFDAIQYAKKNNINCVLIDTAGRMHTQKNLLREMEKIVRVCKPDIKLFIGESITGNDAVEQVNSFNETIGIDGIILTKTDVDEKGGTALSVGYVTKKPIFYLGTGQEYKDIEPFDKNKFVEKLGL